MTHSIMQSDLEALAADTGTTNQRERYAAGVLPEDELLALARVQLFKEFAFPRWNTRIDLEKIENAIRRGPACSSMTGHELVVTTVTEPKLDANEWAMFKEVTKAASRAAQHSWISQDALHVELSSRVVTCTRCQRSMKRAVVKVSIDWAGRTLVREYALDVDKYLSLGGVLST